ncbi:hypothetical protein FBY31_0441 [Arthrobacter sp. SLBN-100]|jgi:hypothetical protein|uniref:hypothetical protein n=1 Tax=Arthrobacter sp. SLBN-100 TaxID=2768450 RepID=UPI00115365EE|nr:hypothetical protein [Arthrobacter sp. SLBN-100]TQJ66432.1 hypothetical protein FBY31_0441 [Arthrobacter sp. SLBN-100]
MPPEASAPPGVIAGRPGRKAFRLWRAAALAGAACVALALYAASPLLRPPDSDEGTLRGLQIRVLNISQAAAENRMDGALAALEALEKDLNDAAGQGLISLSRYRGIEAAVEDVRADIAGQLAAASADTAATASDTSTPDEPAQTQQAPGTGPEQPAVVPVPAPSAVQPEPVLPDPASEARGKGKVKGKP